MSVIATNETGSPDRIGPHGVNLSKRRGVTRNRIEGACNRVAEQLAASLKAKPINADRASGRGRAQ